MKFLILTAVFATALVHVYPQPLDVSDAVVEHRSADPILFEEHPYYGGLQGHILQVGGQRNGILNSFLIPPSQSQRPVQFTQRDADDIVSIAAPVNTETSPNNVGFPHDFNKIQEAAARLVAIQELAKRKGAFSEEDNKIYASSLLELGQAAQNLALMQQKGQIKDFSILLHPEKFGMPQKPPFVPPTFAADQKMDEQTVDEVTELHTDVGELLPPSNQDLYEDAQDSVAVMAPKKDASVAESKPVGLSIAGEGGVASSKPNAIALSGRNGLAVASPKATAIAGVSPEEAAAFSISLPSRNQLVIKSPNLAMEATDSVEYDYVELPSARPHLAPGIRRVVDVTSVPMRTAANIYGDALVNKWRTAIAEGYAATPVIMPRYAAHHVARKAKP